MDLGVRDDRLVFLCGVTSRSDDRVVVRDDRTDGNFPSSGRAFCVANRFVHEVVDEIWGWWGVHDKRAQKLGLARWEGDHSWSPI